MEVALTKEVSWLRNNFYRQKNRIIILKVKETLKRIKIRIAQGHLVYLIKETQTNS
jgi:hypothetical protein